MQYERLIAWLLESGGAIVRWRTAGELLNPGDRPLGDLLGPVLEHPLAKHYVDRFVELSHIALRSERRDWIHGSADGHFENVVGKLYDYGLGKGVPALDDAARRFICFAQADYASKRSAVVGYVAHQIPDGLSLLGYAGDPNLREILATRLAVVDSFVRQGRYDIYVDPEPYRMPRQWRERYDKLVDPALIADPDQALPTIYDLLGLAGIARAGATDEEQAQIDRVLRYISDPRYASEIDEGHGVGLWPNGRFYSMGWSVHVPGLVSGRFDPKMVHRSISRAQLLGAFEDTRKWPFFQRLLDFLAQRKTARGTYRFPSAYLPERKGGYWVSGYRMGLGENRRQRVGLEVESTFWMLKIAKRLGSLATG